MISESCFYDIFQLIYPTAIDPPGILMLQSIRNVFELAFIKPEAIQFKKEQFNAQNIVDALQNEPRKCPVITAADFSNYASSGIYYSHAMVVAGALKGSQFLSTNTSLADKWFIKCKNSYVDNPDQGKSDQGIDIQIYYFIPKPLI